MRRRIRITESQLRRTVNSAVRRLLRESEVKADDYVNVNVDPTNIVSHVYVVGLWPGSGYILTLFLVDAEDEHDALGKVCDYCLDRGWTDYLIDRDELIRWAEKEGISENDWDAIDSFADECDLIFVTDGEQYNGYVRGENLRLYEIDPQTIDWSA